MTRRNPTLIDSYVREAVEAMDGLTPGAVLTVSLPPGTYSRLVAAQRIRNVAIKRWGCGNYAIVTRGLDGARITRKDQDAPEA